MLIELLRRAAAEAPDRSVVETHDGARTYAACLARAEALARGLGERSVDRFACVVDDVGELVALLCGAAAAGAEACVYPRHLDDAGIAEFAESFGHALVVSDRAGSRPDGVSVVAPDDLARAEGDLPAGSSAAPLLVLTTGTTGRPKGVRHDWRRLVRAPRDEQAGEGARWLLAYNLNQFAGIQILAHVLATRATLVAGESGRPRDAIAAMRELGVTHASGTPTFWRLVVSWLGEEGAAAVGLEQITLGGEAVPQALLDRLARLFPGVPVSQVYAASEFGSAVSVRDGRAGLPLAVLERGEDADVQFRVVDGELQARSRVGMLGYLDGEDASDDWRPTGDLVEVREDRIHFVGRTTEIINVGGVKVHPLPIEEVVGALEEVELVRAYGRANPIAGQIVAVDVVAREGADTDALRQEIRTACEALAPAMRPRSVRFVDDLELRDTKLARPGAAT